LVALAKRGVAPRIESMLDAEAQPHKPARSENLDSSYETDAVMEFSFTEAQQHWYDTALKFAREALADDAAPEREQRGEFWREGFERCARFGIQGLPVPVQYGGQGQDLETTVAAMEGLGYGCPDTGLIFAINAALWTVTLPILVFGTEAQKQQYLPGLCDGRLLGANAASEPEAGSDIFGMQTSAEQRGDSWVLNGRKTWITAGPLADLFVLFATTDPSKGVLGISAFLIERGSPGFHVAREIPKLGMRTAPMGELVFDECILPAESVLGRTGRGAPIFNAALEWERGGIFSSVAGTMRRQLDCCIEHARTRKQFGQAIGKFQSVSNRIVDMAVRLETSRFMLYRYAWAKTRGQDAAVWASMAKLHVSECFVQNSLDAVRVFGASGYTIERGFERDLRDSVGGVIFSGTNDIQRILIAQHLHLG
jgi:alkylation response protein AidB-like acyl-CoA dehydrogenase